jgi:hypothetical protein
MAATQAIQAADLEAACVTRRLAGPALVAKADAIRSLI